MTEKKYELTESNVQTLKLSLFDTDLEKEDLQAVFNKLDTFLKDKEVKTEANDEKQKSGTGNIKTISTP